MRSLFKRSISLLVIFVMVVGLLQPEAICAASASTYYIKINRQENCVTIYEKDKDGKYTVPVKAMVCSTGANKATPLGKFRIGGKYRWHELDGPVYGQYCSRITGHVLFHSVYYSTTDPSTLNYNAYNKLGRSVSHGCVRLTVADAKWIYDNCPSGTVVEIYDSSDPGPLGKPEPIRIDPSSRYRGWDPTDPSDKNPWPKKEVAPTIKGAKNKTLERGSSKSKLTSGVSAVDGKGKELKVKVTGKYDLNKVGKYKITYTATDANGNTAKKTVTIMVKDTKPPKLTVHQSEITITDGVDTFESLTEMKTYFKQFVTATDSGELLSDKYVGVVVGDLWDAWENSIYGTYKVKVYAKDKAGNKSKQSTITVYFETMEDEPEVVPDDNENPDSSESTGETNNADNTENPGGTNPSNSSENPTFSDYVDNSVYLDDL